LAGVPVARVGQQRVGLLADADTPQAIQRGIEPRLQAPEVRGVDGHLGR
jgi:hypothetical protein